MSKLLDEQFEWMTNALLFLKELNPAEAKRVTEQVMKRIRQGDPGTEMVAEVTKLVLDSLERESLIQSEKA